MTFLEIVQITIGPVISGIAVYAGIRADLARMAEKVANAHEQANRANDRLDHFLQK